MQIFYELKGGTVHYGHEHSAFHGHDEEGIAFEKGKLPDWDENHPVHLIGHSFGGVTARALHAYLDQGDRFKGHSTNSRWVISVNTISAPLNGSLMVYSLGANVGFAPVVRWGSPGFCIGILAHLLGFIDSAWIKAIHDFKLDYWKLSRSRPGALRRLLNAFGGFCIHSTTDNAAYDMTLHSQLEWSNTLHSISGTYYSSIVGTTFENEPSILAYLVYTLRPYILRSVPRSVLGIDTSQWMESGFDGLLSARTQEFPFLAHLENFDVSGLPACPSPGVWYVTYLPSDHLSTIADGWDTVMLSITAFEESFRSQRDNRFAHKSSPRVKKNSCPPDMQIPSWQLSDRPVAHTSLMYLGVVSAMCTVVYNMSESPPLATVTLTPHLVLSIIPKTSTDTVEIFSALVRLGLLGLPVFDFKLTYLLYGLCIIADGLSCLYMPTIYEYSMPILKIVQGAAMIVFNPFLKVSSQLSVLRLFDIIALIAKASWFIDANSLAGPQSLKWELVWLSFVITSTYLLYSIYSSESIQTFGACLFLFIWFTRLRDISDAFQVECLMVSRAKRPKPG